MFKHAKLIIDRLAGFITVRNPLLFFSACAGLVGYELHLVLQDLINTGFVGMICFGILAVIFCIIIVIMGRITERTPSHLYEDVRQLQDTINSEATMREIIGQVVEERLAAELRKVLSPRKLKWLRHPNGKHEARARTKQQEIWKQ